MEIMLNTFILTTLIGMFSIFFTELVSKRFFRSRLKTKTSTPAEKLQILIDTLSKSSKDANELTQEIVADLKKRELALAELQAHNSQLATEEEVLKKRIAALKEIPIEVAEYFQDINKENLEKVDKKSWKRDVFFFVCGSIVSILVQLIVR